MADVLKKVPVREQDPKVRATNFEEVCLGYNQEEAMEEAQSLCFHTGSNYRSLCCKKRHCLTLHVGSHQRTVSIIVLQERNQRCSYRKKLKLTLFPDFLEPVKQH